MFALYADKHNGRLPDTWEQAAEQIPASERAPFLQFARQNYDITYHGTTDAVSNRMDTILFREREPRRSPSGRVFKAYGEVDGSARLLSESGTITFQDFEAKNIVQ